MALKDIWKDIVEGDFIDPKQINDVAHSVIDNENRTNELENEINGENGWNEQAKAAAVKAENASKEAVSAKNQAVENASIATDKAQLATDKASEAAASADNASASEKTATDKAKEAGESANSATEAKEVAEDARDDAETAKGLAEDAATKAEKAADRAENATEFLKNGALFANAIRGRLYGVSVSTEDVSPIEHELDLKVRSKNILPKDYIGRTLSDNGITAVINSDGSVTANGTANSKSFISLTPYKDWFITEETAMFSGSPQGLGLGLDTTARMVLETVQPDGSAAHNGSPTEVTPSYDNGVIPKGSIVKRVYLSAAAGYTMDNVTFYPQLEYGTVATEFTYPSMNVEGVNVTVTDGENSQTATADVEGNVKGLMSLSPNMTLTTDNSGAVIDCTYNRDANKVITDLETKLNTLIATIGG